VSEFQTADAGRVMAARIKSYRHKFSISFITVGPPRLRLLKRLPKMRENTGIDAPWTNAAKRPKLIRTRSFLVEKRYRLK